MNNYTTYGTHTSKYTSYPCSSMCVCVCVCLKSIFNWYNAFFKLLYTNSKCQALNSIMFTQNTIKVYSLFFCLCVSNGFDCVNVRIMQINTFWRSSAEQKKQPLVSGMCIFFIFLMISSVYCQESSFKFRNSKTWWFYIGHSIP